MATKKEETKFVSKDEEAKEEKSEFVFPDSFGTDWSTVHSTMVWWAKFVEEPTDEDPSAGKYAVVSDDGKQELIEKDVFIERFQPVSAPGLQPSYLAKEETSEEKAEEKAKA